MICILLPKPKPAPVISQGVTRFNNIFSKYETKDEKRYFILIVEKLIYRYENYFQYR